MRIMVRPVDAAAESPLAADGWRSRLIANRAARSASAFALGTSTGRWKTKAAFTEASGRIVVNAPFPLPPSGYCRVAFSPACDGAFCSSINAPRSANPRIALSVAFLRLPGANALSKALGSNTSGTTTNGVVPSFSCAACAMSRMTSVKSPPPVPPESEPPTMK